MITRTSIPSFGSREDQEEMDITIIRYQPAERTQGDLMRYIRRLSRGFGLLSTIAFGAAALAPDALNVPLAFRPWVFVTFIFWFFAFCAGFFNL